MKKIRPARAEWSMAYALHFRIVSRNITDVILPTGAIEPETIWHAPFTKCDREMDDAEVWRKLDERS